MTTADVTAHNVRLISQYKTSCLTLRTRPPRVRLTPRPCGRASSYRLGWPELNASRHCHGHALAPTNCLARCRATDPRPTLQAVGVPPERLEMHNDSGTCKQLATRSPEAASKSYFSRNYLKPCAFRLTNQPLQPPCLLTAPLHHLGEWLMRTWETKLQDGTKQHSLDCD